MPESNAIGQPNAAVVTVDSDHVGILAGEILIQLSFVANSLDHASRGIEDLDTGDLNAEGLHELWDLLAQTVGLGAIVHQLTTQPAPVKLEADRQILLGALQAIRRDSLEVMDDDAMPDKSRAIAGLAASTAVLVRLGEVCFTGYEVLKGLAELISDYLTPRVAGLSHDDPGREALVALADEYQAVAQTAQGKGEA